ncbi:MAG TPA: exonuclease domain-containing protein [Ktedonobacteraceae bacterium]|nr:exonuclease domain-containing protein [Ktedonobacteraceae bacterium]
MGKQPPIRVALDLETTGLHVEQDAILEVAAVKFQGPTIIAKMETLISPGRSIPYRVQRLTGITPDKIAGAPRFETIARELQEFIGNYPIVGHSIPFDAGFLRRRGLAQHNPLVDTFELASVLLPSLSSYNLGYVAQSLGLPILPGRHRAMVDTLLAMDVFLALYARLQQVDLAILQDLAHLDAPRSWPLLGFFRQELRERSQEENAFAGSLHRGSLGDRFAAQLGMDPRVLSFALNRADDAPPPPALPVLSDESSPVLNAAELPRVDSTQELETLVEVIQEEATEPPVQAEQIEAERAPERQEDAARKHVGYRTAYEALQQALGERTSLLMEVTVGANDYTPALLPALEWLCAARKDPALASPPRLLIACASPQVARRLVDEVLPRLQYSLHSQLPVAYLAEHGGYLCTHRWFGSALRRTSGELSAEQARGMAKLALWAYQTRTGERSELTLLPQEVTAWERISSGVEYVPLADGRDETPSERCLYRRKGYCFVRQAEERAKAAAIVVTTHAGLLDDLASGHSLLRGIDRRLVLDADLLEDEIARWSSVDLAHPRLLALLNTIGAELPDGRYQGLLALAAPSLRENGPGGLSSTPTIAKNELDTRLLNWFQTLRQARTAINALFQALGQLLLEGVNGGNGRDKGKHESAGRTSAPRGNERVDQPLRLTAQTRNSPAWLEVEQRWQQAAQRLQAVIDLLKEAEKSIARGRSGRNRLDPGSSEDQSLAWELAALAHRLLALKRLGQQALRTSAPSGGEKELAQVYWLRMAPTPPPQAQQRQSEPASQALQQAEASPVLYAQVIQTADLFKQHVLPAGVSAILVGVALAVEHHFSFYRTRCGLEADTCPALSVVTEHHEQTLLYMPNDVPEPNMPQYQRHLDETIIQLATALDGQLVALFTSHAALRSSYAAVKQTLETHGILVLGHGIDGSPRQLWQMFHDQERVVLLGTGAFWDGADEVERSPACVLISRLPMPVLNDPPMAARTEQYSDQLHQVTVPMAALRMRRALNRLAWSHEKRNAVVIFDRRVVSKEYGATILHSLPHCSQRQGAVSHMPELVLDWLTASGSWE